MGVEPTQRREAPHTGFEARPTHQDRFPSVNPIAVTLNRRSAGRMTPARNW